MTWELVEEFSDSSGDYETWKCRVCGETVTVRAGGAPAECGTCIARDASEQEYADGVKSHLEDEEAKTEFQTTDADEAAVDMLQEK